MDDNEGALYTIMWASAASYAQAKQTIRVSNDGPFRDLELRPEGLYLYKTKDKKNYLFHPWSMIRYVERFHHTPEYLRGSD